MKHANAQDVNYDVYRCRLSLGLARIGLFARPMAYNGIHWFEGSSTDHGWYVFLSGLRPMMLRNGMSRWTSAVAKKEE
jgi:hypothetical protein